MYQTWRRSTVYGALAITALAVVGSLYWLDWYGSEPPNQALIEPGLWLGGAEPAPPPGCRAVLNLCEQDDPYRVEAYRWSPIHDALPAPSLDWLREQVEFIEAQRQADRPIYVHCRNGVSRSGMVMAAYLMRREGWTVEQSLAHLRSRRPEVRPNPAFLPLLREWDQAQRERLRPAGPRAAWPRPRPCGC